MTTDSPLSSSPPTANIFFRPGDQARLDRLVRAVSEEASSVALVSDSDAVLDHYGRMLAEELRSTAKVAVEIYSPDSTDALMDRFNRILASMSVSEALKAQGSTAPARLLLVYDGRATGVREMQLLARLLKDFPGANTRVALLLHAHAEAGKKIDAFGKRMVRWDVQRPSPEEAQALLTTATAQGQGQEAQALLAYLGDQDEASRTMQETLRVLARADEALATPPPPAFVAPNPSAASQTAAASTLAALTARAARPEPAFQESAAAESPMQVDPALAAAALAAVQPKKRMPTILLVALVALAASALLTIWQRLPDDSASETKAPAVLAGASPAAPPLAGTAPDAAPTPGTPGVPGAASPAGAGPTPEPASPAGPASPMASTSPPASPSPSSAPGPASSVPQKGLVGPVPVPEDADPATRLAAKVAPAAAPPPAPSASPKSVAASSAPAKSPAPSAAPAPSPTPAPAASAADRPATGNSPGNSLAEIKSIPAGFYVQHMSSGEREVVESFWRRNPSLRQARLVELTRIGADGPNFVLLSGPFSTINQARAFMNRPGLPKDMWVREASKIRPLLPAAR